jgi:hypothetical protein
MVSAIKSMQIQASVNPTPTNLGISVLISGRIFELENVSVSSAVISIQVNNPQGTSIHVAIAYTDSDGVFQDAFLLVQNSPGGNYTVFLAADKPGYSTAHVFLIFAVSSPDFTVESSSSALSLQQGQSGSLGVTILSVRGFSQPVNLTAISTSPGINLVFAPASFIPSGTATLRVVVADNAQVGNFTVTILAVSGEVSHKALIQLTVSPKPFQVNFTFLVLIGSILVLVGVSALEVRAHRRRTKRTEEAIGELLKQASADSGYVATARVIARLEELRAMDKVDENTYQRLRKEYEKRLEKSK